MGFGQYTLPKGHSSKDRGHPADKPLKLGRMTVEEILAGVGDHGISETIKSGHNEVTIVYENGLIVCRLRETNIVTLSPLGFVVIDTGGWNTLTTRRHVMNFLNARGFQISMWGDKKGGGNRIQVGDIIPAPGICFKNRVVFFKDGGFVTDLGDAA